MRSFFVLLNVILLSISQPLSAAPSVVTSIKPLQFLVAGITQGITEPGVLLSGNESPHRYAMRPSQMRQLNKTDVIFWIGPELETFLGKPLSTIKQETEIIALGKHIYGDKPHMQEVETEVDTHHDQDHDHLTNDPHVWLNPAHAGLMTTIIAETLSRIDPENEPRYLQNSSRMKDRLHALDQELQIKLQKIQDVPFLLFHDTYDALAKHFNLTVAGAVQLSPDRPAGVKHIREIQQTIAVKGVKCLFIEPQFEPKLAQTSIEGSTVRLGMLDPLGVDLPLGENSYFLLMNELADSLVECLAPSN